MCPPFWFLSAALKRTATSGFFFSLSQNVFVQESIGNVNCWFMSNFTEIFKWISLEQTLWLSLCVKKDICKWLEAINSRCVTESMDNVSTQSGRSRNSHKGHIETWIHTIRLLVHWVTMSRLYICCGEVVLKTSLIWTSITSMGWPIWLWQPLFNNDLHLIPVCSSSTMRPCISAHLKAPSTLKYSWGEKKKNQ